MFLWAENRPKRKAQIRICFWDTAGQHKSHASLLAAVGKQLEVEWRKTVITFHYLCARRRCVFCHCAWHGWACQRWMEIITWVCGQLCWRGVLIPFSRAGKGINQDFGVENCCYLPKIPSLLALFPVTGHVLKFRCYCFSWDRTRSINVQLFH